MIRHLHKTVLVALVAFLLVASPAKAAPIDLLLTVTFDAPSTVGPLGKSMGFSFFESATNLWLVAGTPQAMLGTVNTGPILPGTPTQFAVSLDVASLEFVYFRAYGGFVHTTGPELNSGTSATIWMAEPSTGNVPDVLTAIYGTPWIPLALLGSGFSGDIKAVYGLSGSVLGDWALAPAAVTPVPEPATITTLGVGIATLIARRRTRRADDGS